MMNMVPFLSVYKQGQLIDSICLQDKDTWIVGRHVDCDIHVSHASASRHHLEIQVLHATMELLLTDLQSVHGTRVNGEVVGAGQASCVVKQNDVIELGASTRAYKVEWLPAASSAAGTITEATQFSDEETSAAALSVESSTHSNAESIKILDQRLSPNRISKIMSCKSLNHQENGLLNNRQQLRRENSSSAIQLVQDENVPSPARSSLQQAQQRSGSRNDLLPPRTPARRLAFASLEPSALNVRSPAAAAAMNPSLHMTPGKLTPTKLARAAGAAPENTTRTQVLAETVGTVAEGSTPSKLWLRRCSSEPLPSLVTATAAKTASKTEKQTKPSEIEEEEALSILNPELCNAHESIGSIESALRKLSMQSYESDGEESDYYPSDKENIQPPHEEQQVLLPSTSKNFKKTLWSCESGRDSTTTAVGHGSGMSGRSSSEAAADTVTREDVNRRIPFQPLLCIQPMSSKAGAVAAAAYKPVFSPSTSTASSLDSDFGSRALGLPRPHHQGGASSSPKVSNADHVLRRIRIGGGSGAESACRKWHLVVDTNCLLDADALKCLKQLEGIRETRIIIPKIVVRELDCLKHRGNVKMAARLALKWIEECMVKMPFWIHVQSSSETLPVQITPPPLSPSLNRVFLYGGDGGPMSPTNDDHILECALLFDRTLVDGGRVALLTRDTALKIKAMAEGLTVDSATEFCESLLSPYSDRFLWAGSTVCGPSVVVTNHFEKLSSHHHHHHHNYGGYHHQTRKSSSSANSPQPQSSTTSDSRNKKKTFLLTGHSAAAATATAATTTTTTTPKGHGKHGMEEFRAHCNEQPQGLQVLLA
ncbi:unnamed protein product [Sphagnum balticum]